MNIGEAAGLTSLPAKTIRYYEEIGLVNPSRQDNGYRHYSNLDVQRLQFLRRARALGFSVRQCRALLSLYEDRKRASADVKALAETHLSEIDHKISELQQLRHTLEHLIDACHGDERPECPILDGLSGDGAQSGSG